MKEIVLCIELEASTSLRHIAPGTHDGVHLPIRVGSGRRGLHRGTAEAYSALAGCYNTGDQVVLFGAGAGGASVCLLAKALGTVGLVEPGHHLFDFIVSHWLSPAAARSEADWARITDLAGALAGTLPVPITYVGLLHMIKPAGLQSMPRFLPTVRAGRHARAIDTAAGASVLPAAAGALEEVWFRGGYPDITGLPSGDPRLTQRALDWVLDGAQQAGATCRGTTAAFGTGVTRTSAPHRRRRRLPSRITWVDTGWPASAERLAVPL